MHPTTTPGTDSAWALRAGLALAGLDPQELWVAYVGVGGTMSRSELQVALDGSGPISHRQHDMLACTLNDALLDAGIHFPVAFAGELDRTS